MTDKKPLADRISDLGTAKLVMFCLAGVIAARLVYLLVVFVFHPELGLRADSGPPPIEYTVRDRMACSTVMSWYDQEGPNPSDAEAGQFFMRQSQRADTERLVEVLRTEATNWAMGVEYWSPGAQETCAVVLH